MVRDNNDRNYQKERDIALYRGKRPSQIIPFNVQDIAFLIARLTIAIPDHLPIIHALYFNNNKWRRTCQKCNIDSAVLRNIIRKVRKQYEWLRHHNPQATPFSLREVIGLLTRIAIHLTQQDIVIIQGYYHHEGDWWETCHKCGIPRNRLFRCLRNKVRKPYLAFLKR